MSFKEIPFRIIPVVCLGILVFGGGCAPSQMSPEEVEILVDAAIENMLYNDFARAYESLKIAQPQIDPSDESWEKTTYALAISAWHSSPPDPKKLEEATKLLRTLTQSENTQLAAQAWADIGRILEIADYHNDATDLPGAREAYQNALKLQTGAPEIDYPISLRLAQSYAQELTPEGVEKAQGIVAEIMAKYPDSPWITVAAQYAGDLAGTYQGEPAVALEYYTTAYQKGFSAPARTDIFLWQMAEWAELSGQPERAQELYLELIREFPKSQFLYLAKTRTKSGAAAPGK